MGAVSKSERVVAVPVKPGLFVLRYVSSTDDRPPRIFVQVSPSSAQAIDIIFVPGKSKGLLEEPKDFALVVADDEGQIQLTAVAFAGGDGRARIQVEPLKVDADEEADRGHPCGEGEQAPSKIDAATVGDEPATPPSLASSSSLDRRSVEHFSLMCHVAKGGDTVAAADAWVGGPDAPAVIEGLTVNWSPPPGVLLEYQVLVQGGAGRWSSWVQAGEFAGSRGRGLPILGLRLRLSGGEPETFNLFGEALFFGCPVVSESGRELEFTSYAGVDPMVGLRLRLEAPAGAFQSAADTSAQRLSARNGLRVFKSARASGGAPDHQTA